jgi:hypothetical protein
MQLDVAVDASRETLVDVAGLLLESWIVLHRQRVLTLRAEVALHTVASEPATHLTAGAEKSHGHSRPVVLQLDVP